MDAISNINELPVVNLAQIFEKLPQQDRLNIEQVCKKWQHVGKNLSWSNYRIFDNLSGPDWPDTRAMQIKPFFERCGRYLRHLTLRRWFPETVLSFIKMAPNVQHLQLWSVKLNNESLTELAEIVPGLKSLAVAASCQISEHSVLDYTLGLTDCFKVMTSLEYLLIYEPCLFSQHTFVQFPSNLKYLELCYARNADQILSWVAEGCKNLKGLLLESCSAIENKNLFHAISQIKSLIYLEMEFESIPYEIGYVFKELTELRALQMVTSNATAISAIAQHCKKLEHLEIQHYRGEFCAEMHAITLRLALLPNLRSLAILPSSYSKEQTTEIVNRFITNGILQYIEMKSQAPLDPEVLLEMLRRCKSIRNIALNFGPININFYSKICQVVDEVDGQHRELTGESHPIVEVQYRLESKENLPPPYKWLRFMDKVSRQPRSEMWKFVTLSAGKPDWES